MQKLKLKQNAIDLYNGVIDENLKDFFLKCDGKEVINHTNGYFDYNKFKVSQYDKTQSFELPKDLFDIEEINDEINNNDLPDLVIGSDEKENQKYLKIFESIKEIIGYLLIIILLICLGFYAYKNRQKEIKQEQIKQELELQIQKQKLDIEKTQVLPIKDKFQIISDVIFSIEKNIDDEFKKQEIYKKEKEEINKKINESIEKVKLYKEKQNSLYLEKINLINK